MGTTNEPGVHAYARIAEALNNEHGWDLDALKVETIITTPILPLPGEPDVISTVVRVVWEEAAEYGFEIPETH